MSILGNEILGAVTAQLCQITALGLAVAVVVQAFCRHRPHLAYLLWMLVLLKCLTPPIWSSPLGLFSWAQVEVQAPGHEPLEGALSGGDRNSPRESGRRLPASDRLFGKARSHRALAAPGFLHVSAATLLVLAWLSGSLLLTGGTVAAWIRCYREGAGRPTTGRERRLNERTNRLAERLGLAQPIRVMVSRRPIGPAVLGIFRPRLIVPEALLANRTFAELEPILAHELVHVRRRDAAMVLFELAAKIVWWFHPLVWWTARQASRERERCCDSEAVAGLRCRPATYARCLLDVLELKRELRTALALPGVRPVEVTSTRLEDIMKRSRSFPRRTPRWCWLVVGLAAFVALPGSPLVIQGTAQESQQTDDAELGQKLAELEQGAREAGLTDEETEAVLELAKRTRADERKILQLKESGELGDLESGAIDKLIRQFGHPLQEELDEFRGLADKAGLTEAERKATEKLLIRTGFDDHLVAKLKAAGKLSEVENQAVEKLFALLGHPDASELEEAGEIAKRAELNESETDTLKSLLTRADFDLDTVLKLQQSGGFSAPEAAVVEKVEEAVGKLAYYADTASEEDVLTFVQLARLVKLTTPQTDALVGLLKRADFDERALVELKQSGKLSKLEAAALKGLEQVLGKLEDFVDHPQRDDFEELIKGVLAAKLSLEETKAALSLAERIHFDGEEALRMQASGQLSEVEARAVEKLEAVMAD